MREKNKGRIWWRENTRERMEGGSVTETEFTWRDVGSEAQISTHAQSV